jgi:hypothetical protein
MTSPFDAGDEPLDLVDERVRVADPRREIASGDLGKARTSDLVRDPTSDLGPVVRQIGSREHEGRHPDGREHRPDVGVQPHLNHRESRSWTRGQLEVPRPAPDLFLVVRDRWRRELVVLSRRLDAPSPIPQGHPFLELGSPVPLVASERVIVRAEQPWGERVHGEGLHALRVARRKQRAQLGSILVAEQVGLADMHRVHHGGEVLHLRLEWREVPRREPIGESGPAVVNHDHAREPGQSVEDVCHAGQLPVEEHVRDEPGDVDEVAGALTEDLERDVRSVRRLRVPNLRDLHGPYRRSPRG